jgi:hypothetical protein
MQMTDIIIHDLDEQTTHRVQVPRPALATDAPLRYIVSFLTTTGVLVQHWILITHSMNVYQMSVKGRFIITA